MEWGPDVEETTNHKRETIRNLLIKEAVGLAKQITSL